jgi:hypothetical protein
MGGDRSVTSSAWAAQVPATSQIPSSPNPRIALESATTAKGEVGSRPQHVPERIIN